MDKMKDFENIAKTTENLFLDNDKLVLEAVDLAALDLRDYYNIDAKQAELRYFIIPEGNWLSYTIWIHYKIERSDGSIEQFENWQEVGEWETEDQLGIDLDLLCNLDVVTAELQKIELATGDYLHLMVRIHGFTRTAKQSWINKT